MKQGQNELLRMKDDTPKKTQVKMMRRRWEWISRKKVLKKSPTFFAAVGILGIIQVANWIIFKSRRMGQ